MTDPAIEDVPEALRSLRSRPLFVMRLAVRPIQVVGETPGAFRRVGVVTGGSFAGERLSGSVVDGGNDWQAQRRDGATTLDVRLLLRAEDGALIAMTYRGIRHGPAEVLRRIDAGEAVDPTQYYFRTNPTFETASERHAWLNRVLAIGIGHRSADAVIYSVFEIL